MSSGSHITWENQQKKQGTKVEEMYTKIFDVNFLAHSGKELTPDQYGNFRIVGYLSLFSMLKTQTGLSDNELYGYYFGTMPITDSRTEKLAQVISSIDIIGVMIDSGMTLEQAAEALTNMTENKQ